MCEEKERGLISSVGWERCRFEEMAAPANARVPFTAAQWQELEKQAMIFKYIMASVPVPAELLIPIAGNSSKIAIKGCLELGFSSSSSEPEPWRCRRTDGKKWRCSRDVAPDQKYCERHSHKSRPRSRKLVELPNHSSNISNKAADGTKQPNQTPHFTTYNNARLFTSSFDQSRCLEWFMKGETTVPFASNFSTEWQQFKAQGTDYGLNFQAQHLNEQFSPGLGTESGKDLRPSAPPNGGHHFVDGVVARWTTGRSNVPWHCNNSNRKYKQLQQEDMRIYIPCSSLMPVILNLQCKNMNKSV